ncbi:MAG TPA: hypothetical protein VIH55_05190 [Acidimicrobiia bacterium]
MRQTTEVVDRLQASSKPRRTLRVVAAAVAAATSLIYYLIGLRAVTVIENTEDQVGFGLIAGTAFLVGTVLILVIDSRVMFALGALAQVFIIWMYFELSSERTPSFEVWGVSIRILQALLLGVLAYLAIRGGERVSGAEASPAIRTDDEGPGRSTPGR